jgi:phosphoenolpyruvate---glycerone phosphotransferase subunit DhaL
MSDQNINIEAVKSAFQKACIALRENSDYLITLDQALGDGDLGLTARKIADAVDTFIDSGISQEDIGKFIMAAGMKINSAAPSTMGSLLAIALMQAGRLAKDKIEIQPSDISPLLRAAVQSIQEKGKAKLGDKTMLDALNPAVEAYAGAIAAGDDLVSAVRQMVAAAEKGLAEVTPLRNRIGRAGWLGERTEGKIDPGCALVVVVLKSLKE